MGAEVAVQRSLQRVLATHTGSLPRPADLVEMMFACEEGQPVDPAALDARVRIAVAEGVARQVETGLDVVNDGEMSKPSYATYVKDRLTGFGGEGRLPMAGDLADFPDFAARTAREQPRGGSRCHAASAR